MGQRVKWTVLHDLFNVRQDKILDFPNIPIIF